MMKDLLSALALLVVTPGIDATVIGESHAVVGSRLNILDLNFEILKLLHQ